MAVSALVNATRNPTLAAAYRQVIAGDRIVVSFATVTELRYGALRAGWGELRRRGLERDLAQFVIVQPDDQLMRTCAALRLQIDLVSDDTVFAGIPDLNVRALPAR
jgi:predicted nucleic acid-binding protein